MFKQSLIALALLAAAQSASAADAVTRGRELTQWASPQSLEALAAVGSAQLKAVIAGAGGGAGMAKVITDQIGAEREVFDEFAVTVNGTTAYQRLARHERASAAATTVLWGEDGQVASAAVQTAPPPIAASEGQSPATALALPFGALEQGNWFTYWGGRNVARNYHVAAPDQRFAYDFLVVRDGRSFTGPQAQNASYFCWGQPVLAPAAGRVVGVIDTVADNVPVGRMSAAQPAGNHVIIEHRPGEFSLLGHLKLGSAKVKVGQAVAGGQAIGQCGNSGNSSEPHLHYHLQTTGTFGGAAKGLPAPFRNYVADGRLVEVGEPQRGQSVRAGR